LCLRIFFLSLSKILEKQLREAVTLEQAWQEYVEERKPYWSESHIHDHVRAMHAGGVKRTRSNKPFTQPGILFSLASIRLVDKEGYKSLLVDMALIFFEFRFIFLYVFQFLI
jgi:hypothetical protein